MMKEIVQFQKIVFLLILQTCITNLNAQVFPAAFSQVKIAEVNSPTAVAMVPDGRIFVAEKGGNVKVIKDGSLLPAAFVKVNVNQQNERGLGGIVIDPDFTNNHYVYLFYTTATAPIRNRISRFTASGDVAQNGSEFILLDLDPVNNVIHNGGGMVFGKDGKLYVCVGDDRRFNEAQNLNNYFGKVLRLNKDGSAPADNPFSGSEASKRIWAYGLRNPWTIAIQPGSGKIFVNDVGEGTWEEINDVSAGGKNFGWPSAEGNSNNPAFTNPVFAYKHGSGDAEGCSITGGAFFNPTSSNYPGEYTGKYFFIDFCGNWIRYIDPNAPSTSYPFASSLKNGSLGLAVGQDGNLYYWGVSGQNAIYKIIYSGSNTAQITNHPKDLSVSETQPATFNVSAVGSTPLNYQWFKEGTAISGATASSYTISNTAKSDEGKYHVVVSNQYGSATSNDAKLTVTAFNGTPTAVIQTPANGSSYRAGDIIQLSGNGTDPEEGTLPGNSLSWTITFHHDTHFHPGPLVPNGTNGSFKIPIDGEVSANVFFRITLRAEDSKGSGGETHVDIFPIKSNLNLNAEPAGLQVTLDGQPVTTPFSVAAVSGMKRSLGIISPQSLNGKQYIFDHWKHSGNTSNEIFIADNDSTYTAVFKEDISLGIIKDNETSFLSVSIYPNPVNEAGTINISIKSEDKNVLINVVNMFGQLIFSREINPSKQQVLDINLEKSQLSNGVYSIQVITQNTIKNTMLFITR